MHELLRPSDHKDQLCEDVERTAHGHLSHVESELADLAARWYERHEIIGQSGHRGMRCSG